MSYQMDAAAERRLQDYLDRIGALLDHPQRRASFATYALGLLSSAERKSVEPLAAQACADPARVDAEHQRLLHFISQSDWDDRAVRRFAARYAIEPMQQRAPITSWIIDDTGFPKQGKHSVGVQRQYSGTTGKISNCQVGVSLVVASTEHALPIDFALFLPEVWANDPKRRQEARIPDGVQFQTKVDLALAMIARAIEDGVPRGLLLADADYGRSREFRDTVRGYGFDFAVGIPNATLVQVLDRRGRRAGSALSALTLAKRLGRHAFRTITWRQGTNAPRASRFCLRRVHIVHTEGIEPDAIWLIMEWPEGEKEPTKFAVSTLPPDMSAKQIVRRLKERYRTEQVYEEAKGELGLDHFEGRRFRGWHHHVSVVLCCYAFVIAERARHFPPSALGAHHTGTLRRAA